MKRLNFLGLLFICAWSSSYAEQEPLPTPLTLDYVLDLPTSMSPEVMRQQARLLQAQGHRAELNAQDRVQFDLQARLGKREFMGEGQDYNMAALHMGLPLYDFGRTANQDQAWLWDTKARQYQLQAIEKQFRLDLMQAYFNVLLADIHYRVENEAMAIAYVTLDKVQENHEIGRESDANLYASEESYQKAFVKRQQAQANLRRSRMLLANAMGRSDAVISRVSLPDWSNLPEKLLKVEDYLALALDHNPQVLAMKQAFEASGYRVEGARAGKRPEIRADAWIGQLSSYPDVREGHYHAEVSINVPLYDGGLTKSRVDRERAQRQQIQANLYQAQQQIREQVTNLYFELSLLDVEKQAVQAGQTFADFNLDYKRAIYENELQADLGDAMVRISQAHYDALAFDLKRALLWAKMQALTGQDDLSEAKISQQTNMPLE
ncbi:MAG: TolC family protein [Thiomicrospira sp.]|uniref:TolC family protein n=1 Tax=Thiomicrospira sp. TaxID=935 RepID=UPI001A03590C|nr:TolC family protein [Thiomicrospira sp.]MBE0493615.1 TolC family protein [Thiomicrospira sp.]